MLICRKSRISSTLARVVAAEQPAMIEPSAWKRCEQLCWKTMQRQPLYTKDRVTNNLMGKPARTASFLRMLWSMFS